MKKYEQHVEAIEEKLEGTVSSCSSASTRSLHKSKNQKKKEIPVAVKVSVRSFSVYALSATSI